MKSLRDKLIIKYKEQNRINAVMIEVTHKCPCKCIHCYIPEKHPPELSVEDYKKIFQQLKEEGVFDIGFTGGEPFARKDIWEILEEANKVGFFITVLSTSLLWTKPDIRRLKEVGVQAVEISLLGGTAKTHNTIMRYPGAFEHLEEMVPLLVKGGVGVVLKTTILKENYHEIDKMEKLAKKWKVEHSAKANISPKLDGSNTPLEHALGAEELKKVPLRYLVGHDSLESCSKQAFLTCNAGKIFAALTPEGDVLPCLMLRKSMGNLNENSLKEIWHSNPDSFLGELRTLKDEDVSDCFSCGQIDYCPRCPATTFLETGSIYNKSPNACHAAQLLSGLKS